MGAGGGWSHRFCPLLASSVLSTHLSELSHFRFTMIEDNKENKENKDHSSERGRVTLIFSLENEVGGLIKVLKIFQVWISHKVHLKMGL
jgi:prephenate dehydratase